MLDRTEAGLIVWIFGITYFHFMYRFVIYIFHVSLCFWDTGV